MQRSNLPLRRVLQATREREREWERGTRAWIRACTNPNPSPSVRSSDRTILSVPGLERFWETSRITNYWPGSKWMINLSSWMCILHPWENTGPFIIIRVFPGLFHFGDRDLAGQEGTTPLPEWRRVLQFAPNPPGGARDSSGYQSWWPWLLKTNHLVLIPKHGYQESGLLYEHMVIKISNTRASYKSTVLKSFWNFFSNIHPNPRWVFGRFFRETWQLFEAFEIPRTSGSLNPMVFFQIPGPGGSLIPKIFTWKTGNNSSILNFSNDQNRRVFKNTYPALAFAFIV